MNGQISSVPGNHKNGLVSSYESIFSCFLLFLLSLTIAFGNTASGWKLFRCYDGKAWVSIYTHHQVSQ